MRWLKHLTLAHDDTAITEILEELGPEGYGIYWLVMEHLAAGIERDSEDCPSRSHSFLKWSQICHCSTRIFRKFVERAAELKLIQCRTTAELMQFGSRTKADRLQIDAPKLLKYRDEYSKKSGQSTSQIEKKMESRRKEEVTPPLDAVGQWFDAEFYPIFPRKKSAKDGLKAARVHLKTPELRAAAIVALKSQLPELESREPSKRPYPATWINQHRWHDEPDHQLLFKPPTPIGIKKSFVQSVESVMRERVAEGLSPL